MHRPHRPTRRPGAGPASPTATLADRRSVRHSATPSPVNKRDLGGAASATARSAAWRAPPTNSAPRSMAWKRDAENSQIGRSASTTSAKARRRAEGRLQARAGAGHPGHVVRIYEACNFQDIAGQRIGKVIATLAHRGTGRSSLPWSGARTRRRPPARPAQRPQATRRAGARQPGATSTRCSASGPITLAFRRQAREPGPLVRSLWLVELSDLTFACIAGAGSR